MANNNSMNIDRFIEKLTGEQAAELDRVFARLQVRALLEDLAEICGGDLDKMLEAAQDLKRHPLRDYAEAAAQAEEMIKEAQAGGVWIEKSGSGAPFPFI